jgi:hypothetical protein
VTLREEGIIERMCGDLRPCGIDDLIDSLVSRIYSMA